MMTSSGRQLMRKRDVFHAFMVKGAHYEGDFDMPCIEGAQTIPNGLVPFTEAMHKGYQDFGSHVMIYEDDFRFERLRAQPNRYADRLKRFVGTITPVVSTCTVFPGVLKVWNTYRDRICGFWMQRHLGMDVVPNVRVEKLTRGWLLDGLSRGSLIAVGAHACVKDRDDWTLFCQGLRIACDELYPSGIVWYVSDAYGCASYPRSCGIPVYVFEGRCRGESKERERVR